MATSLEARVKRLEQAVDAANAHFDIAAILNEGRSRPPKEPGKTREDLERDIAAGGWMAKLAQARLRASLYLGSPLYSNIED